MKILGRNVPGFVPVLGTRTDRSPAGKVVVITGGGRGIGAQTARSLVREGARVVIGDIDLDVAQATATALGPTVVARYLDVTDRPGFTAFLDEIEATVGPIDVLINNAGIMPIAFIEDETDTTTGRQLAINLHGVIHGTREAVRRMRPRGSGHIVNIASMGGKAGFPGLATYCATKFGVVGFCEAIRYELRGSGIEVSCVMPVPVHTDLGSGLADARGIKNVEPEDVAEAIVAALKAEQFEVYVPGFVGPISTVNNLLPRAGRDALIRLLRGHEAILAGLHSEERSAYEKRVAEEAAAHAAEQEEEQVSP